jgi:lipoprotein LpqH
LWSPECPVFQGGEENRGDEFGNVGGQRDLGRDRQFGHGDRQCRAGSAKVTIDGQPQNINGQVVCATAGGNYNIAIGEAATGIAVVDGAGCIGRASCRPGQRQRRDARLPEGVARRGGATATKDGNNIKVSGTATGIDMANPMAPVTKPFEIEVTCPG